MLSILTLLNRRSALMIASVCIVFLGNSGSIHLTGQANPPHVYYTATTGKDSAAGTEAEPFRTITKGVSVLIPGDTLLVKAGVYAETFDGDIPSGDSWNSPVTLKTFPGDKVTIRPNHGAERVFTFGFNQHYIIVDGFIMDATNANIDGIKFQLSKGDPNPHHIRIMNSEIKNAPRQGILVSDLCEYLEFINLSVHDNGQSDFDHGIYIQGSHILVENSAFYRNAGWGIHMYGGSNNDNIIRNNRSFSNARIGHRGIGIGVYTGKGSLVYNNLIWDNPIGIAVDTGATDEKIYNNTLYDNQDYGLWIGEDSHNATIKNNVIFQATGTTFEDRGKNTVSDHNLTDDPLFVNADSLDFHLQPDSPAIQAGVILPEVQDDFDGISRPKDAPFDLGAYQSH
ncbi:MAG: right-handed parallel beta-helix repeat-containing protein [Chloroflexota bacterium]